MGVLRILWARPSVIQIGDKKGGDLSRYVIVARAFSTTWVTTVHEKKVESKRARMASSLHYSRNFQFELDSRKERN